MGSHGYAWSKFFAWGLTLSGAVLGLAGVWGAFFPEADVTALCVIAFAGLMGFSIALVNVSAEGALHALKFRDERGRMCDWSVLLPSLACCIGFAIAANIGIHLGWELLRRNVATDVPLPGNHVIDAAFLFLAFAKPAMAWIIEGRARMDAATDRRSRYVASASAGVTDFGTARARKDMGLITREVSAKEIREACEALHRAGRIPSYRVVAEALNVARSRIERTWRTAAGDEPLPHSVLDRQDRDGDLLSAAA